MITVKNERKDTVTHKILKKNNMNKVLILKNKDK